MNTKSPFLPIYLIVAVDVLGLTIVLPLLPFYAGKFGASPLVVGMLVTTFAICQLVSGPVFGKLSDTLGRRKLLLISQAGALVGFLLLALAHPLHSLALIFLSRIIGGATAGNLAVAQAYIADIVKPEERTKAFGRIGVVFGIAFLIGPAITGVLAQFGYVVPVLAAAGLTAFSISATYRFLPRRAPNEIEKKPARPVRILDTLALAKFRAIPQIRPLIKQSVCFFFCYSLFVSGFALFAERRFYWHRHTFGPGAVGLAYAYAGLINAIVQFYLIDKLVQKYGEYKLVTWGFICAAFGYFILGYSGKISTLIFVLTVASFGTGLLRPALIGLITQNTERRDHGAVFGVTQSLNAFTAILAPLLAGFLINNHWDALWTLSATIAAGVGIYSSVKNKKRGQNSLSRVAS